MNERRLSGENAGAKGSPAHALVLGGLFAGASQVALLRVWPLFWLVPLLGYAAAVALIPPLRESFCRWRFGRVTRRTVTTAAVIALGSCAVLAGFHFTMHPEVGGYTRLLPGFATATPVAVALAGVVFSLGNALLEEIVFRGVLYDSIRSQWSAPVTIAATALLFGYGHLHGYPPGALGAVLAGIYGLCLGWLRHFTGGLGLCFLAHIVADATIYALVMHG